jgi:hypothetical protein
MSKHIRQIWFRGNVAIWVSQVAFWCLALFISCERSSSYITRGYSNIRGCSFKLSTSVKEYHILFASISNVSRQRAYEE